MPDPSPKSSIASASELGLRISGAAIVADVAVAINHLSLGVEGSRELGASLERAAFPKQMRIDYPRRAALFTCLAL